MELCHGDTLKHRLDPYVLDRQQACDILHQITDGIAYIHGENLVCLWINHRKISNTFYRCLDSR